MNKEEPKDTIVVAPNENYGTSVTKGETPSKE